MNTQDNYPAAIKLGEDTVKFLSQYEVPPTPINYSVIYHYLANNNEVMTKSIDEYISWHGSLDAVFIESIFLEFFSNSEQLEKSLINPLEDVLTSTIEKLQQQVTNGQVIATNFKKADSALANNPQARALQPLINFINTTLKNSQKQQKQLSEELSQTCDQVQKLKRQLTKSREEAMRDSLTGLYNRRGCEEKLKDLPIESVHTSFVIDIDHFKNINDSFGHAIGDSVLQKVASTIESHLSGADFAVRFGGEEFIVVVANQTKHEAKDIAENIRLAITKLRLKQKKSNTYLPPISVSVGIAEYQQDRAWKSVFEMADSALYQAKSAGRNCCVAL